MESKAPISTATGSGVSARELGASFERAAGRFLDPSPSSPVVASEPPELSVALASYNRRDRLAQVLDALRRQTYAPERFEVVVVLDGCTDGSAEMVRAGEYPFRVELVEQANSGLSAARNRAAVEASREVVVFGDDDILLEPDCLATYADEHRRRPANHVVLGVAWPETGTDMYARSVADWWNRHYRRKAEPGHRWTFVDVADGMASIPRRLFLETGQFDENFRERRQDWEWGIRLFRHGVRFSQSLDAGGRHFVDTSVATMVRHARQEARSDVQLGTKHPEVRGRLLLARFADRSGVPARRARAVFSGASASELAARAAVPLAAMLARVPARPALERMIGRLRTHAYVVGLRDALGSIEALDEFLAPVARRDAVGMLVVDLDEPAPVDVPPVGGVLELAVHQDGREIARVPALLPGEQWDWDSLTERAVSAMLGESAQPATS